MKKAFLVIFTKGGLKDEKSVFSNFHVCYNFNNSN